MPMPSVEPTPLPPLLSRLDVPDDAQLASYLAASARIASFWRVSSWAMRSLYVLECASPAFSSQVARITGLSPNRLARGRFHLGLLAALGESFVDQLVEAAGVTGRAHRRTTANAGA